LRDSSTAWMQHTTISSLGTSELVNVFGAKQGESRTYQIKTKKQTNKLFEDKEFNSANFLQFVELYVPKKDAPRTLKLTAKASAQNNAKQG
jgi:pyruvate decarboxylase